MPEGIRQPTEELVSLLLRARTVPPGTLDKVLRLLRPSLGGEPDHAVAVKLRLAQTVLSSSAADGPTALAAFEQQCDSLRRLNSSLLHPVLALLEPLSFPKRGPTNFFSASSSSSSSSGPPIPSSSDERKSLFNHDVDGSLPRPPRRTPPAAAAVSDIPQPAGSEDWVSPETEALLLQDLLFVFQGIAGRFVKYEPRSEQYLVDPALALRDPVRDTVLCLCELGWLYSKVAAYIQKAEKETKGLVVQAFGYALQLELHDYYRLLAILEAEVSKTTTGSAAAVGAGDGGGLTLLRLRAWMSEPLERLFLMARLVEGAGPLFGGALASRLHGHTRHGDQAVLNLVNRVMGAVCTPLYGMLERWILHGELHDPKEEFLIGARPGIATLSSWHEGYFLRLGMLPSYLPLALAQRVLVIGKSINFMRLCQGRAPSSGSGTAVAGTASPGSRHHLTAASTDAVSDADAAAIAAAAGSEAAALSAALQYGREAELAEVVTRIAADTDTRLLRMIEHRFGLHSHLLALKQFLLLGQGDFVICLMDIIGPELKKRANQLYRHNLTEMLEGALRGSNAQYLPSSVLDRVGVRLLEASPGDSGWEVFSLDYSVNPPLAAIVHAAALSQYRTAFHMLWRLKRVEWTLGTAWRQLLALSHTRGGFAAKLPRLRPVFHRCTLNRARMLHVVTTLSAFLMFEVLESAWQQLGERLSKAKCLDDVIRAHDAYLEGILQRSLLTRAHEGLNLQLQSMLQSILRFCALEDALVADALAALARQQAREADAEAQTKAGNWGSTGRRDPQLQDPPGSIDGVPGPFLCLIGFLHSISFLTPCPFAHSPSSFPNPSTQDTSSAGSTRRRWTTASSSTRSWPCCASRASAPATFPASSRCASTLTAFTRPTRASRHPSACRGLQSLRGE